MLHKVGVCSTVPGYSTYFVFGGCCEDFPDVKVRNGAAFSEAERGTMSESVRIGERTFFSARDARASVPSDAERIRRIPRKLDGSVDFEHLTAWCNDNVPCATESEGPFTVLREYKETEPSLLFGRDRFEAVDDRFSNAPDVKGPITCLVFSLR